MREAGRAQHGAIPTPEPAARKAALVCNAPAGPIRPPDAPAGAARSGTHQHGLTAAQQALAESYYPLALRVVTPYVRVHHDPDELVSEAGWVVTQAARTWSGRGDFGRYLTIRMTAACRTIVYRDRE